MARCLRFCLVSLAAGALLALAATPAFAKGQLTELVVSGDGLVRPLHIPSEAVAGLYEGSDWDSLWAQAPRVPSSLAGPSFRLEWYFDIGGPPLVQTFYPKLSGAVTGVSGHPWQAVPARFTTRLESLIADPGLIQRQRWSGLKPTIALIAILGLVALASLLPRRLEDGLPQQPV